MEVVHEDPRGVDGQMILARRKVDVELPVRDLNGREGGEAVERQPKRHILEVPRVRSHRFTRSVIVICVDRCSEKGIGNGQNQGQLLLRPLLEFDLIHFVQVGEQLVGSLCKTVDGEIREHIYGA